MSFGFVLRDSLELMLTMLAVSTPFLIALYVVYSCKYRAIATDRRHSAVSFANERENADLRREVKALKKRIEVLETIVTDPKRDLMLKIANL